ncbi:DUF2199 domain-containing protein [Nocardia exalbida]|uniref:DUF2199 domain-containing protein n=1 Tax=Nocardia exalbida TaxID=290231 RepID=UPI0035713AA8
MRARLIPPVVDSDNDFEWEVWVSLSQPNFARATELWTSPQREQEPPISAGCPPNCPPTNRRP